ncbi:MAG: AAA family ATPase [Chloroflexia bacterium]|nr:AAA family ATPase [Chloroflexia bacterium]
MTRASAHVRDGMVIFRDGGLDNMLPVGGNAWVSWLKRPETTTFRFEGGAESFTARRERQRGRQYWNAYRRLAGQLRKAYLGRPDDMSLERLEAAGLRLVEGVGSGLAIGQDGALVTGRALKANRHNLPGQLSSFLGRETEVAEVRQILSTSRLVTLTGVGGVGKTRLALRLAEAMLASDVDAVRLVELAALADPAHVPQTVAQAVGTREAPGQPLLATIATALGTGRPLLILDNCEHLLDGCAPFAENLLRVCPDLRLLATSREPLGVTGEVTWRVPSLGLPDADKDAGLCEVATSTAVRLFVERAQAARPGFTLTERNARAVAEVCRTLDGIPLALELAAARMRFLTADEVAARLNDRFRLLATGSRTVPHRHQTLRSAVDWSYDLLTSAERRCFERVSVFAGGFTLDAAEAVCTGDDLASTAIFDLVSRLVDRSFLLAEPSDDTGETRYRLLETLRAYAAERLTERGESERVRARHAEWLTEHAVRAERAFHGPEQGRWLRWCDREYDNARAALAWAVGSGEVNLAVRLASALSWPFLVHQRWSEGLEWAQRALALTPAAPTRERGWLLLRAVELAIFRGDLTSNRPSGTHALIHAWVAESRAIGESIADDRLLLGCRGLLSAFAEFEGQPEHAPVQSSAEGLADARNVGDTWGVRRALEAVARDALRQGDLDAAIAWLQEAMDSARDDGDGWSLAIALNELGNIERARGAHASAGPLYQGSAAIFADLGLGDQPSLVHNLGYVALATGDQSDAAACFIGALTQFRRLGARRGMAECVIGLGAVAAADGRPADAARLFGAGESALEALGTQLWPSNRADYERWLARARSSCTEAHFDQALAEGRALSLDEAADRTLAGALGRRSSLPLTDRESPLTTREREVAQLAARGVSNRQIAAALSISEKTAANHVQHVLEKLDIRSRTMLAARAAELGLVPTELRHDRQVATPN